MYKGYRLQCGFAGEAKWFRILEFLMTGVLIFGAACDFFCYHGIMGIMKYFTKGSVFMGIFAICEEGYLILLILLRVYCLLTVKAGDVKDPGNEDEG